MAMKRTQKQLIIGFIYVFIFGMLIAGFYFVFVREAPSCFDSRQNQGEEGVDCGGPCAKSCLPTLQPITLLGKPKILYAGADRSTLLVRLQNPNDYFAAREFRYDIDLFDTAGNRVEAFFGSGRSRLYAKELKYLIFPNLPFTPARVERAEVTFKEPLWVPIEEFRRPRLSVSSYTTIEENERLVVDGVIVNDENFALSNIVVIAVFEGRFGEISGASRTEFESIGPNQALPFIISHPLIIGTSAASTQLFVFVESS